jgi:hypothetical protein
MIYSPRSLRKGGGANAVGTFFSLIGAMRATVSGVPTGKIALTTKGGSATGKTSFTVN